MRARIVRALTRAAKTLHPCGSPQLRETTAPQERGYSFALRPASDSAETSSVSGAVAWSCEWLRSSLASHSGQIGSVAFPLNSADPRPKMDVGYGARPC